MTMDEILSLLDMSEDDPYEWLIFGKLLKSRGELGLPSGIYYEDTSETLADCAFWLKDEANARIYTAMRMLYDEITGDKNPDGFATWWMRHAKPIHWIVAALLAQAVNDNEELQ